MTMGVDNKICMIEIIKHKGKIMLLKEMKIISLNSLKECCNQYKDNRYFHSNIEFYEENKL